MASFLRCWILGIDSSQSFFSLLATRPAPATWPVSGCIPYHPLCCATPAAGVASIRRPNSHQLALFPQHAHSHHSNACTLAHQSCSLLRLQPCIANHTPSPPASPIKLCRFSSLLPSAPTQEVLLSTHHAHQTERSSGSHRSGCFESPAHQLLGLPPEP